MLGPGVAAARPDSLEAAVDVDTAGLKSPVQSFGVVHAFGAATSLASSPVPCSGAVFDVFSSPSSPAFRGSSSFISGVGFDASRGRDFGIAGTTGIVDFGGCLDATGVVSPPDGRAGCCVEDGVVGLVDSAFSDAG